MQLLIEGTSNIVYIPRCTRNAISKERRSVSYTSEFLSCVKISMSEPLSCLCFAIYTLLLVLRTLVTLLLLLQLFYNTLWFCVCSCYRGHFILNGIFSLHFLRVRFTFSVQNTVLGGGLIFFTFLS